MCCNLCDAKLDRPGQLPVGLQGDDVDTAIALARCTVRTPARAHLLEAGPEAESMKPRKPMARGKFSKEFSTIGREFKQRLNQMLKQALIQDFHEVGREFKQRQNQMLKQALIQDFQRVPKAGQT